jgi:hypothetical protein
MRLRSSINTVRSSSIHTGRLHSNSSSMVHNMARSPISVRATRLLRRRMGLNRIPRRRLRRTRRLGLKLRPTTTSPMGNGIVLVNPILSSAEFNFQ